MQAANPEQPRRGDSANTFTIAVGRWPTMIAHLLLALTGSDAESRLGDDLTRARRLATLLGEGPAVETALSRTLFEPPRGEETIPYVEVELSEWSTMRSQLLVSALDVVGSAAARRVLGLSRWRIRRELGCARRRWGFRGGGAG